jgi:hypothetical protein
VRNTIGAGRFAGEAIVRLPEIGRGINLHRAGFHFDERRDYRRQLVRHRERGPIAENLGIQPEESQTSEMCRVSMRVIAQGLEHFGGDQQFASPNFPQAIVPQLASQHAGHFRLRQLGGQRPMQNDVHLTWHIGQRGIQTDGF